MGFGRGTVRDDTPWLFGTGFLGARLNDHEDGRVGDG